MALTSTRHSFGVNKFQLNIFAGDEHVQQHTTSDSSRFSRLRTTGAIAGEPLLHAVLKQVHRLIRVGLVGCGGRGTGALTQALSVNGSNVKVTAVADAFESNVSRTLRAVEKMKIKSIFRKKDSSMA